MVHWATNIHESFHEFCLPNEPVTSLEQETIVGHGGTTYVVDKLNWTEIFEDTNYPQIMVMEPMVYEGEGEHFDVNATEEEIEGMKDSNCVIYFMKAMEWCLPKFDDGFGNQIGLFD